MQQSEEEHAILLLLMYMDRTLNIDTKFHTSIPGVVLVSNFSCF